MGAEELIIKREHQSISARLYLPEKKSESCVVFSHGLFSSKDGSKITKLAPDIAAEGLALLTFDFSCCGGSGSDISQISIAEEIKDLAAAVEFALSGGYKNLHLFGSSMGAAISLLYYSGGSPDIRAVKSMVLISPPFDLEELVTNNTKINSIETLDPSGYTLIDGISLNNRFLFEAVKMNPVRIIKTLDLPVLCIHGEDDPVVPAENSLRIRDISPPGSETIMIAGGDHNLTDEKSLDILRHGITSWLKKF